MSTNSSITYYDSKSKTYTSIFCKWDGYLSYNGRILLEYYMNEEKVKKLVSFGNMSALCINVEPTSNEHCFDTPEDNVCLFYHRDNNEKWEDTKPMTCKTIDEIPKYDFNYLFKNGKWYSCQNRHEFKELTFDDIEESEKR